MPATDAQIEEARQLLQGDFGRELARIALGAAFPILMIWQDDAGRSVFANGTGFIMRTPSALIGVTADHVLAEYFDRRASGTDIYSQIAGQRVNWEDRIIARSPSRDIATFRMDGLSSISLGNFVKFPLETWPPVEPSMGQGVVYGGYPGAERELVQSDTISYGSYAGSSMVDAVHRSEFVSVIEPESSVVAHPVGGQLPDEIQFGGMSGGPALAIVHTGELVHFALMGVLTQGSALLRTCRFSRADAIQADGTIDDAANF